MYISKPGINIKIIFIVTSVNKFTVPPLRTLRIPERKTCLPIEKPGGCNFQQLMSRRDYVLFSVLELTVGFAG